MLLGLPWWSSDEDFVLPTAGGMGSVPIWGMKTPHVAWNGQEKKKKALLQQAGKEE